MDPTRPGSSTTRLNMPQLSTNPAQQLSTTIPQQFDSTNLAAAVRASYMQQQSHPGSSMQFPGRSNSLSRPADTVLGTGVYNLAALQSPDYTGLDSAHQRRRPTMLQSFMPLAAADSSGYVSPSLSSSSLPHSAPVASLPGMAGAGRLTMMAARAEPAYVPQVENISPTPPPEEEDEEQVEVAGEVGETKENIMEGIKDVDRDIAQVESQIKQLRRKQTEILEEHGDSVTDDEQPSTSASAETACVTITGSELFDRIYAENRRKAAQVHAKVGALYGGPVPSLPLYREPWDLPIIRENAKKIEAFKPKLIEILRKRRMQEALREKYLTERYMQLMQQWQSKVHRTENNPKRLAKEERLREMFEKVFPELRKQREDKEKSNRMDTRSGMLTARYEAEQKQETQADQEEEERRMRSNAVVVPMLLSERARSFPTFQNSNNVVKDPLGEHQIRLEIFDYIWSDREKDIFKQKFVQYGKNFAAICTFLDRKSAKDCVQYYYLTKKRENYKRLLRRHLRKKGGPGRIYKPPVMPRASQDGLLESGNGTETGDAEPAAEVVPECIICKVKIDTQGSKVVTRRWYEHYGLPDTGESEYRICSRCYVNDARKRNTACAVGSCTTAKRKIKPNRVLPPPKWNLLTPEQQEIITTELKIGLSIEKCCPGCFRRITRRMDSFLNPTETPAEKQPEASVAFTDGEIALLKRGIEQFGVTDSWSQIGQLVGRSIAECEQFYAKNRTTIDSTPTNVTPTPVQGIEESEDEDSSATREAKPDVASDAVQVGESEKEAKVEVKEEKLQERPADRPSTSSAPQEVEFARPATVVVNIVEGEAPGVARARTDSLMSIESTATLSADEDDGDRDRAEPAVLSPGAQKYLGLKATEHAKESGATARSGGAIDPSALPRPQPLRSSVITQSAPSTSTVTQATVTTSSQATVATPQFSAGPPVPSTAVSSGIVKPEPLKPIVLSTPVIAKTPAAESPVAAKIAPATDQVTEMFKQADASYQRAKELGLPEAECVQLYNDAFAGRSSGMPTAAVPARCASVAAPSTLSPVTHAPARPDTALSSGGTPVASSTPVSAADHRSLTPGSAQQRQQLRTQSMTPGPGVVAPSFGAGRPLSVAEMIAQQHRAAQFQQQLQQQALRQHLLDAAHAEQQRQMWFASLHQQQQLQQAEAAAAELQKQRLALAQAAYSERAAADQQRLAMAAAVELQQQQQQNYLRTLHSLSPVHSAVGLQHRQLIGTGTSSLPDSSKSRTPEARIQNVGRASPACLPARAQQQRPVSAETHQLHVAGVVDDVVSSAMSGSLAPTPTRAEALASSIERVIRPEPAPVQQSFDYDLEPVTPPEADAVK